MNCVMISALNNQPSPTFTYISSIIKMAFYSTKNILIAACLLFSVAVFAQKNVPEHGGHWVHDYAGILTPQTIGQLEAMLKAERDSTSNQIAVLLMKNLEGGDIDEFANRVFNTWKLGDEKKDNGVLFLIAMDEKQMRIEVGAGLEGVLTDIQSSQINRNEVAPYFRQGQYEEGVVHGVFSVIQTIKGEYKNESPVKRKMKRGRSPLVTVIILIVIIAFAMRRRSGPGGGYWTPGGGYIGGGSWGGGGSSGSWGDFGGGGFSGGGGSSDSW
jgi:uncharacterized protein